MSRLSDLHNVKTIKDARYWLRLSLNELAKKIEPTGDRPQLHVSKSLIAKWENGSRTPSSEQVISIGKLIATQLTDEWWFTAGVKVFVGRRWRVSAWRRCVVCRHWFKMKRDTSRRCAQCIKKDRR